MSRFVSGFICGAAVLLVIGAGLGFHQHARAQARAQALEAEYRAHQAEVELAAAEVNRFLELPPEPLLDEKSKAAGNAPAGAWGTIKGQIVYDAPVAPDRKVINVGGVAQCLANGNLLSDELVVNPKNMGVRWALVWLDPLQKGAPIPIHPSLQAFKPNVEFDQPCCMFEPHVMCLRQGQALLAKNSSSIVHNVNWTGHPAFNPGGNQIVPAGKALSIMGLVAQPLPIKLACNIHSWMGGFVKVTDHPYCAVTDADGKFTIKDAPAGQFRLVTWQEAVGWVSGGKQGMGISIKAGDITDVGQIKMKPPE